MGSIKLDENYTLSTDNFNWVLRYESVTVKVDEDTFEEKEVTSTNESYHGTLAFALKKYADRVLKPEPNVAALAEKIELLNKKIDGLFPSLQAENTRVKKNVSAAIAGAPREKLLTKEEIREEYPNTPQESFNEEDLL